MPKRLNGANRAALTAQSIYSFDRTIFTSQLNQQKLWDPGTRDRDRGPNEKGRIFREEPLVIENENNISSLSLVEILFLLSTTVRR